MIIVDCEQRGQDWFEHRLAIPTASQFDKIITPTGKPSAQATKYMYKLAAEAVSGVREESYQSMAMARGIELELNAISAYELIHDVEIEKVGFIYRNDLKTEGCSPDGLVKGKKRLIEVKNPIATTHVEYLLANKIPTIYIPQVQGELWITGYEDAHFISYYPGLKPLIVRVEPDLKYIDLMEEMIFEFNFNLKKLIAKIS